ncbi:MAG: hypothetical protein VB853_13645, partial [Pirellulales bacterium]
LVEISSSGPGDDDQILPGDGDDVVFGGLGVDYINAVLGADPPRAADTDRGNDVIVGDGGSARFDVVGGQSVRRYVETVTKAADGGDFIFAADGSDVVLGGGGKDWIDGGDDDAADTLLGDNGEGYFFANGALRLLKTIAEDIGDSDIIRGGGGDDVIIGGDGGDLLLAQTGDDIVLGDNGQVEYSPTVFEATITSHTTFGGDDNIFGGVGNDILYDGSGSDEIDGGPGRDIYRLQPGLRQDADGSHDYVADKNGNDTLDFTFSKAGVFVDMDLLTFDPNGFNANPNEYRQPGFRDPLTVDPYPQDLFRGNLLSLVRVGSLLQTPVSPSPFENVIGSPYNDIIDIDPLASGGDTLNDNPLLRNGPPVIRNVDGNNPPQASVADPIPPGDILQFDAKGQTVVDTGFSITSSGIGIVTYQSMETVTSFNEAPRILDNRDIGFDALPSSNALTHWQLDADIRHFRGGVMFSEAGQGDTAIWEFEGLAPGTYRVSTTWVPQSNLATKAPFSVFDDAVLLGTTRLDQKSGPDDFVDQGAAWEDVGIFTISSRVLKVELSDLADEFVFADAVRVERLSAGPELGVRADDGRQLSDGISQVSMDTVLNLPVFRTFTVSNEGTAALDITELQINTGDPITLGGKLVADLGGGTVRLQPDENTTFTVTAAAATGHDFHGEVLLLTNDLDENLTAQPGAGPNSPAFDTHPFSF